MKNLPRFCRKGQKADNSCRVHVDFSFLQWRVFFFQISSSKNITSEMALSDPVLEERNARGNKSFLLTEPLFLGERDVSLKNVHTHLEHLCAHPTSYTYHPHSPCIESSFSEWDYLTHHTVLTGFCFFYGNPSFMGGGQWLLLDTLFMHSGKRYCTPWNASQETDMFSHWLLNTAFANDSFMSVLHCEPAYPRKRAEGHWWHRVADTALWTSPMKTVEGHWSHITAGTTRDSEQVGESKMARLVL